ncbi:MAG: PD-(D/E)XK nuclease-like domain-containing protein, partial [Bacteroidota bacterium]
MSVSTYKSFLPWYGGCEAKAVALLRGEWEEEKDCFLLGNYVHSWNEGRLKEFKEKEDRLFKKNGELYAKYSIGDDMIAALQDDPFVQKVRSGGKEKIITAELFGIPWKAKIDILNTEMKTFTDLKTTRSLRKKYYNNFYGEYQNFIEYYGYDYQMAIYAELLKRYLDTEEYYMPHILAVTKETPPDKAVIHFGREDFVQERLSNVSIHIERIKKVWSGEKEPARCEQCDYC